MSDEEQPDPPARGGPGSLRWWMTDRHGDVVLGQFPNPALAVWLVATVLRWTGVLDDESADTARDIGTGALLVWALDEIVRGATPFRRLLGAVVLVPVVVGLVI
ncbi:MAG TPA: hypothetical protein VF165_20100 [Nocardioidaceae bacterium]